MIKIIITQNKILGENDFFEIKIENNPKFDRGCEGKGDLPTSIKNTIIDYLNKTIESAENFLNKRGPSCSNLLLEFAKIVDGIKNIKNPSVALMIATNLLGFQIEWNDGRLYTI